MRILITGGSGFIGVPLIKKLVEQKDKKILALSRSTRSAENEDIRWVESSLQMTPNSMKQIMEFAPEIVVHLAWEKIPDFSYETSSENLQNHVAFFKQLLTLPSIKKVVVTGSCWEYNKKFGACTESEPCVSSNYFTWAKNSLRDFLQFECTQKNVILIWARVFYVYGPNQKSGSLIPLVINNVRQEIVPDIKKPANSNDFIFVDDVVSGLMRMVQKDIPSGVYNLGSGTSTPVIDIVSTVEKVLAGTHKLAGALKENATAETKEIDFWADIKKSHETLDWYASTSMEEGISKTISHITDH